MGKFFSLKTKVKKFKISQKIKGLVKVLGIADCGVFAHGHRILDILVKRNSEENQGFYGGTGGTQGYLQQIFDLDFRGI